MLTFCFSCHKLCMSVFTCTVMYTWEAIAKSNCNAQIDDRSSKSLTRKAHWVLLLWIHVVMSILHNYKLESFSKDCTFWLLFSQRLRHSMVCAVTVSSWIRSSRAIRTAINCHLFYLSQLLPSYFAHRGL